MEKQADFHATWWEATVAKPHAALYIDIMMDEPTSHSFHFSSYLQPSFIWYAVLCSPDPMLHKVLLFGYLGIKDQTFNIARTNNFDWHFEK